MSPYIITLLAMSFKHRIVFSYDAVECIPQFLGYGHNLKEKNLCLCDSTIFLENDEQIVYSKKMNLHNLDIELFVTYKIYDEAGKKMKKYSSANLIANGKEYIIPLYCSYNSLQIEKWCYDNIDLVKLPCNIFI
jgi:hypothetical protein